MRSRVVIAFVLAALVSCLALPVVAGPDPGVLPPQAKFEGMTYGEWSAAWWQWQFGLPTANHPLADLTGADAAAGQSGNVWFLGGLFWNNDTLPPPVGPVTRNIKVPAGTALFFPIVNNELNPVEKPGKTLEEIKDEVSSWVTGITKDNMYATIDGRAVGNCALYRAVADDFTLQDIPEDNFLTFWGYDFAGGDIEHVFADGYFLLVPPLSVGQHKITFGVKDLGFEMDIIYNITVLPKGKYQP